MRIFIANFSFTTTEDELERLFEPYGIVNRTQIITDRDTGRSRGFGFVEMPDVAEAQAAIEGLQGAMLGGRTLTVNEARPREGEDRPRRPQDERRPRGVRAVRPVGGTRPDWPCTLHEGPGEAPH